MATVYLAQDLKHERQVAIKVLREDLSASLGAGRFLREVKIAAQLQHPHILPLLDSGEADGFLFFVMPYIKGQSLRERLAREGELPVHEAVRLVTEVVDALVEAHAHGVVHRDIKPDNVMLSGRHALVTDFGVAKAISEATGRNTVTTLGVAVGTPTYMSPEQAAADPNVDHRSDIYSVGVMAYEMLSGRPPFTGSTPQQVLAAHVTESPDSVAKRRPSIPAAIEAVVMRCLAKRPADRFQTAAELHAALEPLATPSGGLTPVGTTPVEAYVPGTSRTRRVGIAVGVIATVVIVGVLLTRRDTPVMTLGTATQISAESPGLKMQPAISADGEWVAYAAGTTTHSKIFVRRIGGGRPIPLTDDTVSIEQQPRFSPDGKQILFLTRGGVAVAPAQGGQAAALVPGPDVDDANWSPTGDRVAYVRRDSLLVRSQNGERPQLVTRMPGLHACQWSPDAALFACTLGQNNYAVDKTDFGNHSPTAIVTIPSTGGPITYVTDSSGFNLSPVWGAARQLYFVRDQNHQRDIFTVTVTADGHARGAPVRITSGLSALGLGLTPDGRHLVYTKYSSRANIWSLPVTAGKVLSIGDAVPVTAGDQTIESIRVSRDGQWLVFDSDLSGTSNIFRVPVGGGTQEQLTQDSTQDFAPDLSPDGKSVAFHSWRTGTRDIFVLPLDGGPLQQVTRSAGSESYPIWSPDGKSLSYIDQAAGSTAIVTRRPDGSWGTPKVRLVGAAARDWSPDGRFLLTLRGTDSSVAVLPADSGAGRVISRLQAFSRGNPTVEAHWNADGERVFVKLTSVDTTRFWSVPLAGGTWTLLGQLTDPFRTSDRRDFAVDRSRLYFALTDRQSDLWVVDLRKP